MLVVVAAYWLQAGFLASARPFGVVPNLMLVVILYAGLTATATETLVMALAGGLLLDLASGTDFGLRLGFYLVAALAVLVMRQLGVNLDHLGLIAPAVAVGTVLFNLGVLTGPVISRADIGWGVVAARIGIEAALNLLLALLLRWPVAAAVRPPGGPPLVSAGN